MDKETQIRKECCEIWNGLKDKTKMIDYLIESKRTIADLETKLAESEKTEDGAFWFEKWQHKKRDYDSVYKAYIENCAEVDQLKQQLAEKDQEIEIEKKVSDWLYNIHNRTKFEEEVTQKYKTATEITKQCNLYEHCKNQFINDLRNEVKKKLKD